MLGKDPADGVEGHAEHLGAPHVEADGEPDVGSGAGGGQGRQLVTADSTRAFSSSSAVCMMRNWARRLMKPGSGTRSSTSRT